MKSPVNEKSFRKDLSHLSWDEVYARQVQRAELVDDWMKGLHLKSGDRVFEIGPGPGYVSFILADRVGPAGVVYAVDRSAEALAYLKRQQKKRGVTQIQPVIADAALVDPAVVSANSALVTMVLHHADDPAGVLHNVAQCVPPGGRVVIGEFHPEGPCSGGPPRDHRLSPEKIQEWCERASLSVVAYRRQTVEHYMMVTQRDARSGCQVI